MFSIDGITWDVPCTIERTAEVTPSEISGLLLNKRYFNDVLGTYMKYKVRIAVPIGYMERYADIYETLTQPVDGHTFVLPYNEDEIEITGRVQVISDRWVKMPNDTSHWRDTTFTVIANHPSKEVTLGQAISTGITPEPSGVEAEIGDLFEYTATGWVQRFYTNADEVYY